MCECWMLSADERPNRQLSKSSTIVQFCGLVGPLPEGNFHRKMTTIVGNRGQLWTSAIVDKRLKHPFAKPPFRLSPRANLRNVGVRIAGPLSTQQRQRAHLPRRCANLKASPSSSWGFQQRRQRKRTVLFSASSELQSETQWRKMASTIHLYTPAIKCIMHKFSFSKCNSPKN